MVLPVDVRVQKLQALRDSGKAVGKTKLFYKGHPETFDVYQVDLDHLVFNRHNGRIESEMLTWQLEHDLGEKEYTEEVHRRIADFLWKTNIERNKHTLEDLRVKQQQRPGIISLDGVLIDGNRRAMLLGKIKPTRTFEAVILPDTYYSDEKAIVRLETEFQIGEDSKLDYGPLEKYLKVKRLRAWYEVEEIAEMMAVGDGEVRKLEAIMKLMDDYLEHIDCAGLYTMLKESDGSSKEGMFVDLYLDLKRLDSGNSVIPWVVGKMDKLALRTVQFDYIRLGSGVLDGKDYRAISHNAKGQESFFAKGSIWKTFLARHKGGVTSGEEAVGTLQEFLVDNPDFPSRSEAAIARESKWREAVKGPMEGNFNRAHDDLEAEIDKDEPRKLLERALAQLSRVDYCSDSFVKEEGNERIVKDINTLVYEMKRRFDRPSRV